MYLVFSHISLGNNWDISKVTYGALSMTLHEIFVDVILRMLV